MNSLLPPTGINSSRKGDVEEKLLHIKLALAEHDQRARLKGIEALGGIRHPDALDTALNAFQACRTGPDNGAAQRSIVRLCGYFPERSADAAGALVELISASVDDQVLTLTSDEFSQSCRTMEAVLRGVDAKKDVPVRVDAAIGSWYERIKEDFNKAPNDVTHCNPRDLVPHLNNSIPDDDRRYMLAVQSMAMLAELMEGIQTPKVTEIKRELLAKINPNGFGEYVLQLLSSHNDPELKDAVGQTLERWGRSATTPKNRFVMACNALFEMLRSESTR